MHRESEEWVEVENFITEAARPSVSLAATPNLNGNTPKDFKRVASELSRALDEVQKIFIKNVNGEILHGRNYQTVNDGPRARQNDVSQVREFINELERMRNFAVQISENADE